MWAMLDIFGPGVSGLRATGPPVLNWLYLVEANVVFILIIFWFFWFPRVLGWIVASLLRLFFWKSHNAYIEIGAIQFSPLGGRIFFSDFRYISRNQSFRVLRGYVIWHFWFRHVRSEEDKPSEARLPCRLTVTLEGAEWFLYNRTPSFDSILEQLGLSKQVSPWSTDDSTGESTTDGKGDTYHESDRLNRNSTDASKATSTGKATTKEQGTDWLRESLPIDIRCDTGAIIMGNQSTPSIIIAGFDSGRGTYAAIKSRSRFDAYKQAYSFTFKKPKIVYRSNPDYQGTLFELGEMALESLKREKAIVDADLRYFPQKHLSFANFRDLKSTLTSIFRPKTRKRQAKKHDHWAWKGLARYTAEETDSGNLPYREEYAKVNTLLVSPEMDITYYCDVPGKVPPIDEQVKNVSALESWDIGNGDLSPEWGVDIEIKGGTITYGPWADRQRGHFQQAFTPATFFDHQATPRLLPGQERVHTAFKMFVEFSRGVTYRIPTREPSKDWQYRDLDGSTGPVSRSFGWIDVALGSDSTVTFVMPVVATSEGYDMHIEIHLDHFTASSSVNYVPFISAKSCRIHCALPSPLKWNILRTWTFDVNVAKPEIYLLRDHIFLMTDLAKDWTSSPPGEEHHFVPFNYALNVAMTDYTLKLYLNDHNIINNSTTDSDNTLLLATGPRMDAAVLIPSHEYEMQQSDIKFDIDFIKLDLSMSLPDWNTHAAFLTDRTRKFATAPELSIDGSYRFYANAHPDNVEQLALNVKSKDLTFKALGWLVRHTFNLRDNYFGAFTHFVTLEEYRHRHERNLQGDPLELKHVPGATDNFEVVLSFETQDGLLLLPQEVFDCKSAVALALPTLQVDLRNHDYFMEMALNIDPLVIGELLDCDALNAQTFESVYTSPEALHVQGIDIMANRLFGPQPRTATYMCVWTLGIGKVLGSAPIGFTQSLARAGAAFGHNFDDIDNALPPEFAVLLDPDATFVNVDIDQIDIVFDGPESALHLEVPEGIAVRFDDLASERFLKHISVEVPSLAARALLPIVDGKGPWIEVASFATDLSVAQGITSSKHAERKKKQRDFIAEQDASTGRCTFVYSDRPRSADECRLGTCYLPVLDQPCRSGDIPCYQSPEMAESAAAANASSKLPRLPSFKVRDGRFGSYASALALYERSQREQILDRPAFRRATHMTMPDSTRLPTVSIPSLRGRLDAFDLEATDADHETIAVDVRSKRSMQLFLTPLTAQVVANMTLFSETSNAEQALDRMYGAYLSARPSPKTTQCSVLMPRVLLPGIELRSIQDVLRPIDKAQQAMVEASDENTMLSLVRLSLVDVRLDGAQTIAVPAAFDDSASAPLASSRHARTFIGSVRLVVGEKAQKRSIRSDDTRRANSLPSTKRTREPAVLDLRFGRITAQLAADATSTRASLENEPISLDFVDEASELVIGSLWAWHGLRDAIENLTASLAARQTEDRQLVVAIAEGVNAERITSFPVFLSRVSYLVGASVNYRLDDKWKLLHQLRHCARSLPHLAPVKNTVLEQDLEVRFVDATENWPQWDIDVSAAAQDGLLAIIFGRTRSDNPSLAESPVGAFLPLDLSTRIAPFTARLYDHEEYFNQLRIGPVDISGQVSTKGASAFLAAGRVTIHEIKVQIDRSILQLVRHIANARRTFEEKIVQFQARDGRPQASGIDAIRDAVLRLPAVSVEASVAIKTLQLSALSGNLELGTSFDLLAVSLAGDSAALRRIVAPFDTSAGSLSASVSCDESSAFANDIAISEEVTELLRLTSKRAYLGATLMCDATDQTSKRPSKKLPISLTLTHSVADIDGRIPQDITRVYSFFDDWRAENLPVYDSLLTELKMQPVKAQSVATGRSTPRQGVSLTIPSMRLKAISAIQRVRLDIAAGSSLRLQLAMTPSSAVISSQTVQARGRWLGPTDAAVDLGRIEFGFALNDVKTDSFALPALHLRGSAASMPLHHVSVFVMADPVLIVLNAQIVDNVLAMIGRISSDLDRIIDLVREHRSSNSAANTLKSTERIGKLDFTWEAVLTLRGFRLGLVSPGAIQWLEAKLLEGHARVEHEGKLHWKTSVRDLGLALTPKAQEDPTNWKHVDDQSRLAFFGLDLEASNERRPVERCGLASITDETPFVCVKLPRLHAILQPVAIEALSDFVEYVEQEVQDRLKTRSYEIEAVQKHVKETIEISAKGSDRATADTWLASCIFVLDTASTAFVIPLGEIESLDRGRWQSKKSTGEPAFMVALPRLHFEAQKGSAASATVERFTIQFVRDFDKSNPSSFDAASSSTLNRICLPKAEARLRRSKSGTLKVQVSASGLEIDVEASVVSNILGLVRVYHLSRTRFAKYAERPVKSARGSSGAGEVAPLPSSSSLSTKLVATFESASGVIRAHSPNELADSTTGTSTAAARPRQHRSGHSITDFSFMRRPAGAKKAAKTFDIFRLPEVSAHATFESADDAVSRLHAQINIHESQNTLYPTLIPFIVEVLRRLKESAVQPASAHGRERSTASARSESSKDEPFSVPNFGNVQVSVGLRIDRSRLEISCQPVATTARLNWDSGRLQLVVDPVTNSINFAVSADGVEAGLRHALEYVDTLQASAQGLSIAASFSKDSHADTAAPQHRLSVVANVPAVSSSFSMRHFEYWLCFKAVWLDRLPLSDDNAGAASATKKFQSVSTNDTVLVAVLVNLDSLKFSADLGSTFGRVTLQIARPQGTFRVLPGDARSFAVELGRLLVTADGAVNGEVKIDSFSFSTRLRSSSLESLTDLLHISMRLGRVTASIKAGAFDKLLLAEIDPVGIEVDDDWRKAQEALPRLALHFAVDVPNVIVLLSTSTLPYLIWAAKGVASLSKEQEEKSLSHLKQVGISTKPHAPVQRQQTLSAMASRLGSLASTEACERVELTDKLDIAIGGARLYLFADSFEDPFFYRAELGKDSKASLTRTVDAAGTSNRHLRVGFGRLALYSQQHSRTLNKRTDDLSLVDFLSVFASVGSTATLLVPSPTVDMRSIQQRDSNVLEHWFKLHVAGQIKIDQNLNRLKHAYSTGAKFTERLKLLSTSPGDKAPAPEISSPDLGKTPSSMTEPTTADSPEPSISPVVSDVKMDLPVTSAVKGKEESLVYKEHEVDIPDVVIDALGEATRLLPYVLGTGSTRAKIPGLVHMFVTIPLEELLIALSSTYQTQLARQKLAERSEDALDDAQDPGAS